MRNAMLMVALCCCVGLIGCGSSEAEKARAEAEKARRAEEERAKERVRNIERVLAADKGTTTGVRSVAEVVARMRAISLAGCPTEFSSAYLAHIHAWESVAVVERKAIALKNESESTGALVEAFIRGVLLDPFGKANEIKAEFRHLQAEYEVANREVKQTFHKVEQIAVAQGATLPSR